MTSGAEHLRVSGVRNIVTEALGRALHLAEFGVQAYRLGPERWSRSSEPCRPSGKRAIRLQSGAP